MTPRTSQIDASVERLASAPRRPHTMGMLSRKITRLIGLHGLQSSFADVNLAAMNKQQKLTLLKQVQAAVECHYSSRS